MRINGEMLCLAREYRDLTQDQLAASVATTQSTIAKIESGLRGDIPEALVTTLAKALALPESFFLQEGERLGFGSSSFFYRKRATITATDRRAIHSTVNLQRLALRRLLQHVEIRPRRELPSFEVEWGKSPADIARAVRALWQLPDGPIRNLTALIESAGVVVLRCRFPRRAIDATSMRLADMPPLIFINDSIPGDRWRYTLAHELAHLIMHWANPTEMMEVEADQFAAEFLVPEAEITPQLLQLRPLRYAAFLKLKRFWLVSMQMLMRRANDLSHLTAQQYRYQMIQLSKSGERLNEREPIEREAPSSLEKMIKTMTEKFGFSSDEIATTVNWGRKELEQLFFVSDPPSPRLRLVN